MPEGRRAPEVTVVVRDGELHDCLEETLSSVRDDQEVAAELIVVGDGPGEAEPRGEFVMVVRAGDLIPRGALRSMLDAARAGDADLVIGRHLRFAPTSAVSPLKGVREFDRREPGRLGARPALLRSRVLGGRLMHRGLWPDVQAVLPASAAAPADLLPSLVVALAADRIVTVPGIVHIRRAPASVALDDEEERLRLEELECSRLLREHGDTRLIRTLESIRREAQRTPSTATVLMGRVRRRLARYRRRLWR